MRQELIFNKRLRSKVFRLRIKGVNYIFLSFSWNAFTVHLAESPAHRTQTRLCKKNKGSVVYIFEIITMSNGGWGEEQWSFITQLLCITPLHMIHAFSSRDKRINVTLMAAKKKENEKKKAAFLLPFA